MGQMRSDGGMKNAHHDLWHASESTSLAEAKEALCKEAAVGWGASAYGEECYLAEEEEMERMGGAVELCAAREEAPRGFFSSLFGCAKAEKEAAPQRRRASPITPE